MSNVFPDWLYDTIMNQNECWFIWDNHTLSAEYLGKVNTNVAMSC